MLNSRKILVFQYLDCELRVYALVHCKDHIYHHVQLSPKKKYYVSSPSSSPLHTHISSRIYSDVHFKTDYCLFIELFVISTVISFIICGAIEQKQDMYEQGYINPSVFTTWAFIFMNLYIHTYIFSYNFNVSI